jgi:hypothetical protein
MTIEELMIPRFKVLNTYPECTFKVDDILVPFDKMYVDSRGMYMGRFVKNSYSESNIAESVNEPQNYPWLFRKLDWHEDRDRADIPLFLKHRTEGMVEKIESWFGGAVYFEGPQPKGPQSLSGYLPITEEEYIKSKGDDNN